MNVLHQDFVFAGIEENIRRHPAWIGRVSGLKADKLLRGKSVPYLYIIRAGEYEGDYYVTFLLPDLSIKHTPFVITSNDAGWSYDNTGGGGPYTEATIDDVIHLIMHCGKDDTTPFMNFQG